MAIPREVLSEHFQHRMEGWKLKTGVFLTFRFDPGFFEREVLPVFLDVPRSHAAEVGLLQLEDAIRDGVDHLAVYYDPRALTGEESAKLDIRRVPVLWPTGYFHPKNVFLLLEDAEPDQGTEPEQKLLIATLSANLTEDGWWRNVEVCHIEELRLGEKSGLRDDVLRLVSRVKRRAAPSIDEHAALEAIRRFVVKIDQRSQSTSGGVLHTRLYVGLSESGGTESVPDFLTALMRNDLRLNLEVISPYFDDADVGPLRELVTRFQPREVRVFLPRDMDGKALCRNTYFDSVKKLPNTQWGKLPADLLRSGSSASAVERTVHAKVYRFFSQTPRYEALFVGSVNLTAAAHSKGGNFETGFLVELAPKTAPDWWLSVEQKRPAEFHGSGEEEGLNQGPGIRLALTYNWDSGQALAMWDHTGHSPLLRIKAQGIPLFDLGPLAPRATVALSGKDADALRSVLRSTALLTVEIDAAEPAVILVQEEGMAKKPSLLLNLSVKDILRCWASLTPEQKAVLLEQRYQELKKVAAALMASAPLGRTETESFFDAFAGIFHAFGSLERRVFAALQAEREKEAVYLLFGEKYDSLPRLVHRILDEEKQLDGVTRYVILLCGRQLVKRVEKEAPDFFSSHRKDFVDLEKRLAAADEIRSGFTFGPGEERERFFEWYERWFVEKARPLQEISPD